MGVHPGFPFPLYVYFSVNVVVKLRLFLSDAEVIHGSSGVINDEHVALVVADQTRRPCWGSLLNCFYFHHFLQILEALDSLSDSLPANSLLFSLSDLVFRYFFEPVLREALENFRCEKRSREKRDFDAFELGQNKKDLKPSHNEKQGSDTDVARTPMFLIWEWAKRNQCRF